MPFRKALLFKWLLFSFLILQGFFSYAQLKAGFTASTVSGCSPIVVTFTDTSAGKPTSWKWDLGNGTVSFLRNPSVTYFTPGQYNIKLVISNSGTKDSITKLQYITVYAKPAPEFSESATAGCFPLLVQFKDLSVAVNGDIIKREWDYGDGVIDTAINPTHIYQTAGNFNISLRVTNSFGCVKSITKPQYIKISTGVLADFDISIISSCKAPATINFTNTSTGTGQLSYQWNFGDGKGSTLANPSNTYLTDGNYNVKLIVNNTVGCTDTINKTNAIILGNTKADFSSPTTVCKGSIADIINLSQPAIASLFWDFGDGTTSTGTVPAKQYATAGNYLIKMIADFGSCQDSISKLILVLDKPIISFTADKTIDCKSPFTVKFTNNTSDAISYVWDFGDGTSSSNQNPTHTYTTPGSYDVRLIATNLNACSDTMVKPGFIQITQPEVSILELPVTDCAPFNFTFASKVTATESVVSYKWIFGDGSTSSAESPSHTYLTPGSYTVSVIVTTSGGCTDTATYVDGVIVGNRPVAIFTANPKDVCAFLPVSFSDLSTGNVDEWYWQFGDGGTSSEQNPSHLYADTGYFNVTLIVINNGCADTIKANNYIHIMPPVAKFLVEYDCILPLKRVFINNSIGADASLWDFGDNTGSAEISPNHNYQSPGTYIVTLTVTNFSTGCAFKKQQTISIINEKANFTALDTIICKGTPVIFNTVDINGSGISSYSWNFGDGASTSSGASAAHIYTEASDYSVTLIITDFLGCTDTLVKPLYIHVDGPTALFNFTKAGSCLNSVITFTDSSFSDGTHNIEQWFWNYGDNASELLLAPPFQHSYLSAGVFAISLKVTDSKGCSDSLVQPNTLIISEPIANFTTIDTISCPQKPIAFSNTSTGPDLTYLWNFGDGSTSSLLNPVHEYLIEGVFSISLAITDKYGCTDYLLKKNYIKTVIPVASFLMSDSISNCPPLVVKFSNTSSNAISSLWDFGDGTTAVIDEPSHFYALAGVFTITLTITGAGGCIDQVNKKIIIKGPSGNFNYTNIVGCVPLTTNFQVSAENTTSIVWDFNDGITTGNTDSFIKHEYINPGIYLPKVILIDAVGCHVPIVGNDTIIVYGVSAGFNRAQVVICDSGAVSFIDNSVSNDLITLYQWSFDDGTTSNLRNPVHTYKTSGSYFTLLIVTTQSGCIDSLKIPAHVKVINSPEIAIEGIVSSCVPATVSVSGKILVADTSELSWQWNFSNGNTSTLQNPPKQVYNTPGNYMIALTAANSSGCAATVSSAINAYPIPLVTIIADSNVCSGQSVNLSVQGATTYNWTPASSLSCTDCANPIAIPDSSTKYLVTGTSTHGCAASDSISISVKFPFEIQVSKRDTLCAGNSTMLTVSGGEKYVWSPAASLNNPALANPVATPTESVSYRVIASDNMGCYQDTGFVPVTVYSIPTVDAGNDKTINVGKTIELLPVVSNDVTMVNWSPTSGIFRNSYPGISVKPNESLEYTVEVSNRGGCMARDRVTVNVLCNDANVFIPNTFSPNGDGANDIFFIRGSGVFQIKVLKIFNRWGEVVFERSNTFANNSSSGWDGSFNGKKLLPDIYVYTVAIVCDNNSILTYKGNIALLR
jgi:gliding motility-associated-like protein